MKLQMTRGKRDRFYIHAWNWRRVWANCSRATSAETTIRLHAGLYKKKHRNAQSSIAPFSLKILNGALFSDQFLRKTTSLRSAFVIHNEDVTRTTTYGEGCGMMR